MKSNFSPPHLGQFAVLQQTINQKMKFSLYAATLLRQTDLQKRGFGLQELRNHEKWEQTKSKNIGFSLSHFVNLLLT